MAAPVLFLALARPAAAQSDDITQSDNWPCTTCHPVGDPGEGDPVHTFKLEGHDRLGTGLKTCLNCHASDENPAILLALDNRTVPIETGVPALCERCHFRQVAEWRTKAHGKGLKCTGCHNPHSPANVRISLAPFRPGYMTLGLGARRHPLEALPARIGGPEIKGDRSVRWVAGIGFSVFVGLTVLALRELGNGGKGGDRT